MGKIQKLMTGTLVVSLILVVAVLGIAMFTQPPKVTNSTVQSSFVNNATNEGSSSKQKPKKINYDMDEVSKHDTPSDCWVVISQRVYDMTSYIPKHPGGRRTITTRCGTEATSVFIQVHSNAAWDILKDYKIGNLRTG